MTAPTASWSVVGLRTRGSFRCSGIGPRRLRLTPGPLRARKDSLSRKETMSTAASVYQVDDAETLQALSHPTRVAILEALREPASAASVARTIGQPRQRVNYHLKELEHAGLVERVGEER